MPLATRGKVFTLKTLTKLVECSDLAKFRTKKPRLATIFDFSFQLTLFSFSVVPAFLLFYSLLFPSCPSPHFSAQRLIYSRLKRTTHDATVPVPISGPFPRGASGGHG
jgi:hypothetical protein